MRSTKCHTPRQQSIIILFEIEKSFYFIYVFIRFMIETLYYVEQEDESNKQQCRDLLMYNT